LERLATLDPDGPQTMESLAVREAFLIWERGSSLPRIFPLL
jgi:hypothetical protein